MRKTLLLRLVWIFPLLLGTFSCSPSVSYVELNPPGMSKAPGCDLDVFPLYQPVPYPTTVIGEIRLDDTGFTIDCDMQSMLELARIRACNAGADAIQIVEVRPPDMRSTCYRIRALFLKYSDKGKPKKFPQKISVGTAWPSDYGLVITSNHVVNGHRNIQLIRTDGSEMKATVIVRDPANDIALLEVADKSKLPPAILLSDSQVKLGSSVFTIGYPHPDMMGVSPKLTSGTINSLRGFLDDPRVYQISVPLQTGNSGGPLLNMTGEAVGIVTSKLDAVKVFGWTGDLPQNVNYAVKIPYLKALLSAVPEQGRIESLPRDRGTLEELGERIKDSVMLVIAGVAPTTLQSDKPKKTRIELVETKKIGIGVLTNLERKYFNHLKRVLGLRRGNCELIEILDRISYDKLDLDIARTLKQKYQIDMVIGVKDMFCNYRGDYGTYAYSKIIHISQKNLIEPRATRIGGWEAGRLFSGWEKKLVKNQIRDIEQMIDMIEKEERKPK